MKKPTSELNYQIISFLMENEKIANALKKRDAHEKAAGMELHCRFIGRKEDTPGKTLYAVDFIYETKNDFNVDRDDITVTVEVNNTSPVSFEIIKVDTY